MQRREFLKITGVGAAGTAMGNFFAREVSASARPNVLFILVDQMRTPRFTPLLKTPNINRLAASADEWRRYLDYYIHCCEDVDANTGRVLQVCADFRDLVVLWMRCFKS